MADIEFVGVVYIQELDATNTLISASGTTLYPFTTISLVLKGPGPGRLSTDESDANSEWSAQWDGNYTSGTKYTLTVTAPEGTASQQITIPG